MEWGVLHTVATRIPTEILIEFNDLPMARSGGSGSFFLKRTFLDNSVRLTQKNKAEGK